MSTHCREMMRDNVERSCAQHPEPFDCPDRLIFHTDKTKSYGIIVHDGGASWVKISYCPWCGQKLPA